MVPFGNLGHPHLVGGDHMDSRIEDLAHPPEFDPKARIAGLRLSERWGGWNGEAFTATSWRQVSVHQLPAQTATTGPGR